MAIISDGQMKLELLGGFLLTRTSVRLHLPLSVQRLIAILALKRKPLQRSYVAGLLWPEVPEDRARGNLSSTVWRLRGAPGIIEQGTRLGLREEVQVDVEQATDLAREVIAEQATLLPSTIQVLMTSGELLPDWHDDWLQFERERFNQLRLLALDCLCQQLSCNQRLPEATAAALAAVQIEPLRESSQRLLLECLIRQGNRVAAARQYKAYSSILQKEMGLSPSTQLGRLLSCLDGHIA